MYIKNICLIFCQSNKLRWKFIAIASYSCRTQTTMSAPTLSDLDDVMMEMKPIPAAAQEKSEAIFKKARARTAGYRDTPQEEVRASFDEDDDDGTLDIMVTTINDPALKKRSYLFYIFAGVAVIALLVGFLPRGNHSNALKETSDGPSLSSTTSNTTNSTDLLTIEFTVANLRTNSQSCVQVGKMLQCIPGHNNATNKFRVRLHPEWAPIGVQRFQELTEANFWDDARIFRVVPNFVSQFGISSYPDTQEQWESRGNLKDDKVIGTNKRGMVTFATAGPNTRTTQIFINSADNSFLDRQGFSPIGEVLPAGDGYGGMDVVDEIYSNYREDPDQIKIKERGKDYLEEKYPLLSYFLSAVFV
jgi:cyclophilin family peptidyl-prolyl cis-trans isomerase